VTESTTTKLTKKVQNPKEKTTYDSETIREAFDGYKCAGFEFVGMDSHTDSIRFGHEFLPLELFVCPECAMGNDSDIGSLRIQLRGRVDTPFEGVHVEGTTSYEPPLRPTDVESMLEYWLDHEVLT